MTNSISKTLDILSLFYDCQSELKAIYYQNMKSAPMDQLNALSKKTKRQRMQSYNHRRLSEYEMRRELENVIQVSSKSNDIIELLKSKILNIHEKEKEKVQKKSLNFFKEEVIRKIQDLNAGFFNPKIEVTCFNRKIDRVLEQVQSKIHLRSMMDITTNQDQSSPTAPQSPKRPVRLNKIKQESNQTNLSRKCSTLPAKSIDEGRKSNALFNQSPGLFKRQSSKKSNTFLFNIPTRKIPKKSPMKCELKYDWQQQLLENINFIQKTNIKSKNNVKVDRQKLSNFLKERYLNEVVTSYFRFEPIESFNFVKNTIQDLIKMGEKEMKMVTFFTYDYNQDGFICEQDIYRFLQFLPYDSKILADINMIIQFLRKNKLRSLETNLPNSLLKKRQKTVFDALTNQQQSSFSKIEIKKKKNLAERMFSISKKNEELPTLKPVQRSVFKKFQINFDVFCLIFAQKIPILILQIIKSLTQKINPPPEIVSSHEVSTPTSNRFIQTRNKDWITRMNNSKQLVVKARNQQEILSQKID